MPYRDPDRLVAVWETNRGATARNVIAPANYVAWRERARTLDGITAIAPSESSRGHVLLTAIPSPDTGRAELRATIDRLRSELATARDRGQRAVEQTHRQYRRELVPVKQALAVFEGRRRR